jgi:hypothetical protein
MRRAKSGKGEAVAQGGRAPRGTRGISTVRSPVVGNAVLVQTQTAADAAMAVTEVTRSVAASKRPAAMNMKNSPSGG